jgi:ribosomal protein S13
VGLVFTVRAFQVRHLSLGREQEFAERMIRHLEAHYPDRVGVLRPDALRTHVEHAIGTARGLGLSTERAICRHLNLCMTCGWGYLDEPENAWMRDRYLGDAALGAPDERMRLLVDEVLRRMEIEAQNQRLRSGA